MRAIAGAIAMLVGAVILAFAALLPLQYAKIGSSQPEGLISPGSLAFVGIVALGVGLATVFTTRRQQ